MKKEPSFADFGILVSDYDVAACVEAVFNNMCGSHLSVNDLLLHPQIALELCQRVRVQQHWYNLPDYMILRALRDK